MSTSPLWKLGAACATIALAAPTAMAGDAPTFAKDVAPIFYNNCVSCHRPGQIAPMSLITYQEVRPWAKSIQRNVTEKVMPPWHAHPKHGEFSNDRSLTAEQIATIDSWVKRGAPRGNPADMPPKPEFPDAGWQLGEPDLVVEFPQVEVPANGPDRFHDLVGELDLDEDKWVTAVEVQAGNPKVVHHVIIYQDTEDEGGPQGWLGAWAAGTEPMIFKHGSGRLLRKSGRLIADMHYHPAETPEKDITKIGLHFAEDNKVEKEMINLWVANQTFEIPAGDPNHRVRASYTFNQDSHIHSLLPHMHYRGKDFSYIAQYPDGTKETLLKVEDYDFNWQTEYKLKEPKAMPKGTTIHCIAHFDNSADNPVNPDPTRNVRFGDESYDEMMIGFVDFTVDEGVRPETAEDALTRIRDEFVEKYPGQIYDVALHQGPEAVQTVLRLEEDGASQWILPIMGMVREAELSNMTFEGGSFEGRVSISGFGAFPVTGQLDRNTGKIEGTIPVNDQFQLTFDGKRVD